MQATLNVKVTRSGEPVRIPNLVFGSISLEITYQITGSPDTLSLILSAPISDGGEVLDSYAGLTDTTRTVLLSSTYDSFELMPDGRAAPACRSA